MIAITETFVYYRGHGSLRVCLAQRIQPLFIVVCSIVFYSNTCSPVSASNGSITVLTLVCCFSPRYSAFSIYFLVTNPKNIPLYRYHIMPVCASRKNSYMSFTTVLHVVAEKRFLADAAITDNMVQRQRKEEGGKKGTSRTGKIDGRRGREGDGGGLTVSEA